MKKTLLVLLAVGLIVFGGYTVMSGRLGASDQAPPTFTLEGKQLEYTLAAEKDGQTALELLQASEQVELSIYEFGSLVKSIDNLAVNDAYYWAFYVNGEYAQQAADKTILTAGDKVEFKYEKIEAFPAE